METCIDCGTDIKQGENGKWYDNISIDPENPVCYGSDDNEHHPM
jgi:hypothetical protein